MELPVVTEETRTLPNGQTFTVQTTRYKDGRLTHYFTRRELNSRFRRAKYGKTPLELSALDEMMDVKKNAFGDKLIGLPVDWHGHRGVVERYGKNEKLSVRVRIGCDNGCGRRITLHVFPGVHIGAFCIVRDENGKYVADLRDVNSYCGKCK